mgnify:CR=1 FL=1
MNRDLVVGKIKALTSHDWVVDTYNSIKPLPRGYKLKNSDPWCAATVSAIFHDVGYDDLAECSCPKMIEKAQKLGIWVEDDAFVPQKGDLILYDWQDSGKGDDKGTPDHIGIVIDVSNKKMVIREGNKSGKVGNRDVLVDSITIRGFITPPYEAVEGSGIVSKPSEPTNTSKPTKPQEKPKTKPSEYIIGSTYTISVKSALNVRKGAGTNYGLVGYNKLSADGKKHAYKPSGALKPSTKVTCLEIKKIEDTVWMRIPSGWICAIDGNKKFVI